MDAIELEFDNHCYLYLYLYLVEKMEIIVVGIGKWVTEKCECLEFIKYGVMCQSFLSGRAGLKGRIFFQFSFAFSGLSFVPTALQKETEAWGDGKRKRWEKTAIMAL